MKAYKFYLLILVLFLTTPLRSAVIVLMPLALPVLFKIHPYTITKKTYLLIILFILSGVIGLLSGTIFLANFFLSSYIVLPLIVILFAQPQVVTIVPDLVYKTPDKLRLFIKYVINVLIVVNIVGVIAYFVVYHAKDDDALHFAYGAHFAGVNGLAMLNACIFFYFISKILAGKWSVKNLRSAFFFFAMFIFCFFGTGLICLILTLAIFGIAKARFKQIIIASVCFTGVFFAFKTLNPRTFNYMANSLTIDNDVPRKLLMFQAFGTFVDENRFTALVGVGPGGYNGRAAFLLNRESDNLFTAVLGHHMPPFHAKSIFVLWNKESASFDAFTDGARNKPFSSIVSILSEYGIIFGIFFLIYYFSALAKFKSSTGGSDNLFLFLIYVFWFLAMTVDMWLESSEFLFFVVFQFLVRAERAKVVLPPVAENNDRQLELTLDHP